MSYKIKKCKRCGKEFIPNSGHQKYCPECRVVVEREGSKRRYEKNYEKKRAYASRWNREHRERKKTNAKQWYERNCEREKMRVRQWRKINPERAKAYNEQWKKEHPERIKEIDRKHQSKRRRNLDYEPVNKPFEGCEGHHLSDGKTIIYIPEWLHRSVWHNSFTGQGMEEINTLAVQWWIRNQILTKYHKEAK